MNGKSTNFVGDTWKMEKDEREPLWRDVVRGQLLCLKPSETPEK
jgi:hypothetical protein